MTKGVVQMRNTVPRLTLKQTVADTLLMCTAFFVTAMIGNAWPFRIIVGLCFLMAIVELFVSAYYAFEDRKHCNVIFCTIMMIVLLTAIVLLYTVKLTKEQYLLWMGVAMASDAFGLIFGRLFGTRRAFFSKNISPNKTYAGYIGEFLGSAMAGLIVIIILRMPLTNASTLYVYTGFVACVIGDLLGSAAKRELCIKDSDEFMKELPIIGKLEIFVRSRHGFLDCFDSASVALIYFAIITMGCL